MNLDELDRDHRSQHARAAERIGRPEAQRPRCMLWQRDCCRKRTTEKTSAVLPPDAAPTAAGDQRIGSSRSWAPWRRCVYAAQDRVAIAHATLHAGDPCPECRQGKVYRQKEPATLVRFVGHAPLEATVFEMERLRCNAVRARCSPPTNRKTAGPDKYDETAVAMIALLKYGTGVPFNRLEKLQNNWECRCRRRRSGISWPPPRNRSGRRWRS